MDAVKELLKAGYVIAGHVVKEPSSELLAVDPWNLAPEETVGRIEREWREINNLDLGDIVWLELTDKGRKEAERLDGEGCEPFKQQDAGR